jgi:hypothetical protein
MGLMRGSLCLCSALIDLSCLPPRMIQESDLIEPVKEGPGRGLRLRELVSRF